MKTSALSALLLLGSGIGLLAVQAPTSSTRAFEGRVVDAETGEGVRHAVLLFPAPDGAAAVTSSDADGRFSVTADARTRSVNINKAGYAMLSVGISAQFLQTVRLPRGAILSGRVIDASGAPVAGVSMAAESVAFDNLPRRPPVGTANTDDRGEFRIAGLVAGTFRLVALSYSNESQSVDRGNGVVAWMPASTRIYYPGSIEQSEGETITLRAGEERSGLDYVFGSEQLARPFVTISPMTNLPATAPDGTAVVGGRVLDANGRPVSNADVGLLPLMVRVRPELTKTGEDGRFEFRQLVPGRFRLVVAKQGYARTDPSDGVGAASWDPFDLKAGERSDRFAFRLSRFSVVSGLVVDEFGDPMQGIAVQLLSLQYEHGQRVLAATGASATSDDQGRYRLAFVRTGQYVVSASGASAGREIPGYPRSYYPGTVDPAQARYITVPASSEVGNVDVPLVPARAVRVAGRIVDAAGRPTSGGSLMLISGEGSAVAWSLGARLLADGRFEFLNVPPGQYVIQADRGRKNGSTEGEFGALRVAVAEVDVTGLTLQTTPGTTVAGTVQFDASGAVARPARGALAVTTVPVSRDLSPRGSLATAEVDIAWGFRLGGLHGPRRFSVVGIPRGWALATIRAGGIDVTDRAIDFGRADGALNDIEVVLTDRVNRVTGQVADAAMRPAGGVRVALFAMERDRWYFGSRFVQVTRTDAGGSFTLEGAPDGAYFVAAFSSAPAGSEDAWRDPAVLEELIGRATSLTLDNGQSRTVPLSLRAR